MKTNHLHKAMPYRTNDVFENPLSTKFIDNEIKYGNGDLIKIFKKLGIAGPFRVINPWRIEDNQGVSRIISAGYSASPFGEMYPPLIEFLNEFLAKNQSTMLAQQTSNAWRSALETNLIHLLASVAPNHHDSQVFFSNSGAEAFETALKFAKANRPKAKYLINFKNAYHGKTFGALSLTPSEKYQSMFRPLLPHVVTLDFGNANLLEDKIKKLGKENIVGIFLEPIQGEAGVVIPPKEFLQRVEYLRKKYDLLVVADEIQTGLGRTGYMFASIEWGGLEPDIITLAKPLGGGIIPIGATIARKNIYKKMLGKMNAKIHSSTYGGGTLAMAIGLKSLEIIIDEGLVERAATMGKIGLQKLREIQANSNNQITDVRGMGLLMAIQLQPQGIIKHFNQNENIKELIGLFACLRLYEQRVFSNFAISPNCTIRLTPALTMPEELYTELFDRIAVAMSTSHLVKFKDVIKILKLALV